MNKAERILTKGALVLSASLIVLMLMHCEGGGDGVATKGTPGTVLHEVGVRYCPDGVCKDGSFVPHWKIDEEGNRVWVDSPQ